MTVDAIKKRSSIFPQPEQLELADWFSELKQHAWDLEMESDFAPGGRGGLLGGEKLRRI